MMGTIETRGRKVGSIESALAKPAWNDFGFANR